MINSRNTAKKQAFPKQRSQRKRSMHIFLKKDILLKRKERSDDLAKWGNFYEMRNRVSWVINENSAERSKGRNVKYSRRIIEILRFFFFIAKHLSCVLFYGIVGKTVWYQSKNLSRQKTTCRFCFSLFLLQRGCYVTQICFKCKRRLDYTS